MVDEKEDEDEDDEEPEESEEEIEKSTKGDLKIKEKLRLTQYLARCIIDSSWRQAKQWILEKKVSVLGINDPQPSTLVDPRTAVVFLDGKKVMWQRTLLLMHYKKEEMIVSRTDPEGRKTLMPYLRNKFNDLPQLTYIGRLDFMSEGLLLLTNNGRLAKYLSSPENEFHRIYKVRVHGFLSPEKLASLNGKVYIENNEYLSFVATRILPERGYSKKKTNCKFFKHLD